jgi:hypothetical protein
MAVPVSTQDTQVIHLVGTASHEILLQSNNPHYLRLYQENMVLSSMLRARVNNERCAYTDVCPRMSLISMFSMHLINDLQARMSELEGNLVSGRSITSIQGHGEKSRILSPLSIPAPLPPLERKDFPEVRFWTLKEWNTYKATQQRNNETICKLTFVTTSNGGPVTNQYLEQISETARMLFNELYNRGLAPSTWKAKSRTASDFFINTIVLEFPELRWCEGGKWKAEAFAVTRYPDCSRKFFNTGSCFSLSLFKVLLRSSFLWMIQITTRLQTAHVRSVRPTNHPGCLSKSGFYRLESRLTVLAPTMTMSYTNQNIPLPLVFLHYFQWSQIRLYLLSLLVPMDRRQISCVCRKHCAFTPGIFFSSSFNTHCNVLIHFCSPKHR